MMKLRSIGLACLLASMNVLAMEQSPADKSSYWKSFYAQVSKVVEFLFDDDYAYGDLYSSNYYKKQSQGSAVENDLRQLNSQKNSSSATILTQSDKDLQNVLLAISFLEKTKNTTVQRKLTQADIADVSMLKVDHRVETLFHQKPYKKLVDKNPSHR
jgi:hypothetical protein